VQNSCKGRKEKGGWEKRQEISRKAADGRAKGHTPLLAKKGPTTVLSILERTDNLDLRGDTPRKILKRRAEPEERKNSVYGSEGRKGGRPSK